MMETNNRIYEPMYPEGWEVKFTLPEDLNVYWPESSELNRISPEAINFDSGERSDDKWTIAKVMEEWRNLIEKSKQEKLDNGYHSLDDILSVSFDEDNPLNATYHVRKPIDEMSEEEKDRLRKFLKEGFNATDEQLKQLRLL